MGATWIESLVHGQSNNQMNWNSLRIWDTCHSIREQTSKKQRKITFFQGKKQGVTGRGRYRGCYKNFVTLTGVTWVEISIGPLRRGHANLLCNDPVTIQYRSCIDPHHMDRYRIVTGALQDRYSGCLQSNSTVWGCLIPNHNVSFNFIKWSPSAWNLKNIKLHIVTDIKVNFNSMLDFRISQFGWGVGYFILQRKLIALPSCIVGSLGMFCRRI